MYIIDSSLSRTNIKLNLYLNGNRLEIIIIIGCTFRVVDRINQNRLPFDYVIIGVSIEVVC